MWLQVRKSTELNEFGWKYAEPIIYEQLKQSDGLANGHSPKCSWLDQARLKCGKTR
jgi:3-methyladenine DNA glycosylase Tag